jgi:hypothetical protein
MASNAHLLLPWMPHHSENAGRLQLLICFDIVVRCILINDMHIPSSTITSVVGKHQHHTSSLGYFGLAARSSDISSVANPG